MRNSILTLVFFLLAIAASAQCDRKEDDYQPTKSKTMYLTIKQVEAFFTECIAQNETEGKETYTKKEVSDIYKNCLEQIKELEFFAADTVQTKNYKKIMKEAEKF